MTNRHTFHTYCLCLKHKFSTNSTPHSVDNWVQIKGPQIQCFSIGFRLFHVSSSFLIRNTSWVFNMHYFLIYLFLAVLGLHCCVGFSLLAASKGYSRCGSQASHCGSFSRCGTWALGCVGFSSCSSRLQSTGPVVVVHGIICPMACGIIPDQGWDPCLPHWQVDSLPLSHQRSPTMHYSLTIPGSLSPSYLVTGLSTHEVVIIDPKSRWSMPQVHSASKGPDVVRPEIMCPMHSEMPGFGAEKGLLQAMQERAVCAQKTWTPQGKCV